MEKWAREGTFDVNWICICVNGDKTSLPVSREFGSKYKMLSTINGFIASRSDLPSFGQLGCQGLIVVDAQGNFITKKSNAFTQEGERAWRKLEKLLFQLGVYKGKKSADAFEEPPLRLAVGSRVECRMGRTLWVKGQIVAQRIQAMGREMPYKILLDDGRMTFAPMDSEQIIRKDPDAQMEIPSVGVKEMDDEHDECYRALQELQKNPCLNGLKQVHRSLKAHFQHEEALFAKTGFGNHGTALSGTKSHCDDHTRILSEIESHFGREITKDFARKITDRVISHTRNYDSKYAGKIQSAI